LEKAGWSNADHWLRFQTAYDLAQARQHEREIKVERYVPRSARVVAAEEAKWRTEYF